MNQEELTNAVNGIANPTELAALAGTIGKAMGARAKTLGARSPHTVVNRFQSNLRTGFGVSAYNKAAAGTGAVRGRGKTAGTTGIASRSANVGKRGVRKPSTSRARRKS